MCPDGAGPARPIASPRSAQTTRCLRSATADGPEAKSEREGSVAGKGCGAAHVTVELAGVEQRRLAGLCDREILRGGGDLAPGCQHVRNAHRRPERLWVVSAQPAVGVSRARSAMHAHSHSWVGFWPGLAHGPRRSARAASTSRYSLSAPTRSPRCSSRMARLYRACIVSRSSFPRTPACVATTS